jgi:hypothetical protein
VSTILISDPAGFNTQRVPVTGVSRSWVVNGSGSLSAEVISADLVTFGLNDELRGYWIVVEDDDAGTWGGVISDTQANGDGTTEIGATDWKALFSARRLPNRTRPLYGPSGTLALQAITEATRQYGTPIQVRYADDLGLPVSLDLNGGDLLAALDGMANESGQEWWIEPDTLIMWWGVKGRDLTGSIQLSEGRHISDWRAPTSIAPVINDLEAFPTSDRAALRQTVRVENAASISAIGRRQGSAGIAGGSHGVHIRNRAIGLVNELAAQGLALEFDLLNVDDCFQWFREGDSVCVLLPTISEQLTVRIMARSLDDSAVMRVSATVLTERVLA